VKKFCEKMEGESPSCRVIKRGEYQVKARIEEGNILILDAVDSATCKRYCDNIKLGNTIDEERLWNAIENATLAIGPNDTILATIGWNKYQLSRVIEDEKEVRIRALEQRLEKLEAKVAMKGKNVALLNSTALQNDDFLWNHTLLDASFCTINGPDVQIHQAGVYRVDVQVLSSQGQHLFVELRKNGGNIRDLYADSGSHQTGFLSMPVQLNSGDRLQVHKNNGVQAAAGHYLNLTFEGDIPI